MLSSCDAPINRTLSFLLPVHRHVVITGKARLAQHSSIFRILTISGHRNRKMSQVGNARMCAWYGKTTFVSRQQWSSLHANSWFVVIPYASTVHAWHGAAVQSSPRVPRRTVPSLRMESRHNQPRERKRYLYMDHVRLRGLPVAHRFLAEGAVSLASTLLLATRTARGPMQQAQSPKEGSASCRTPGKLICDWFDWLTDCG